MTRRRNIELRRHHSRRTSVNHIRRALIHIRHKHKRTRLRQLPEHIPRTTDLHNILTIITSRTRPHQRPGVLHRSKNRRPTLRTQHLNLITTGNIQARPIINSTISSQRTNPLMNRIHQHRRTCTNTDSAAGSAPPAATRFSPPSNQVNPPPPESTTHNRPD